MKAGMRLYLWNDGNLHERWADISLEEYYELENIFCAKEDRVHVKTEINGQKIS